MKLCPAGLHRLTPARLLKDRDGVRCKLCHNKANREAAARRRVREAFTRAAHRMGVLR